MINFFPNLPRKSASNFSSFLFSPQKIHKPNTYNLFSKFVSSLKLANIVCFWMGIDLLVLKKGYFLTRDDITWDVFKERIFPHWRWYNLRCGLIIVCFFNTIRFLLLLLWRDISTSTMNDIINLSNLSSRTLSKLYSL